MDWARRSSIACKCLETGASGSSRRLLSRTRCASSLLTDFAWGRDCGMITASIESLGDREILVRGGRHSLRQ